MSTKEAPHKPLLERRAAAKVGFAKFGAGGRDTLQGLGPAGHSPHRDVFLCKGSTFTFPALGLTPTKPPWRLIWRLYDWLCTP